MVKILVTGSNGLLGQKLTNLLERDASVQLVTTAAKPLLNRLVKGKVRMLDITDADVVTRTIQETKPDVIINAAAMTQVDQCESERQTCWKANVTAVENLVHASRQNGVHLVHVSTDFI